MTYTQIGTIDTSGGVIYRSDRGFASSNLLLLDNPVLKLDFNNSASDYVIITFTDSNSEVVAEWTVDDTIKVNYVEIGDVLRYAVQPVSLTANQFTNNGVALTMTIVAYDSNNVGTTALTASYTAFRSSVYTSPYNSWYTCLPSKLRMVFSGSYYDYSHYNIVAAYARTGQVSFRAYNGTSLLATGNVFRNASSNYLAASQMTSMKGYVGANAVDTANVEQPACPEATIALKWWTRIGGCWKSILLDVVGGGYTNDNTIDYWTDMVEDQLKGGTTYISARFPNATYKDYLYYSDIIMGEYITASVRTVGGFEDAPVKVSGSWSYKQNDIKDMDFTITIKTYDIDD